jgi:DNA-binding GntR family transcriptional regulator
VRDRRRLFVAAISAREAEDIYQTRELLEEELTALGVPRLTAEDKHRLTELTRQMEAAAAADDQTTYHSLTRQFHFLAFERADRPWVVRFLRILWDASARYQRALFEGGSWRHAHVGHHRALLEAFVSGNVERVNQIMRRHRQWLIHRTR